MTVENYRDLVAWQKGMDLVEAVYRVSAEFPPEELYGLIGQVRRAAVSIPSNIAEGQGRQSTRDFISFLLITRGSLKELETQLLIAEQLAFCDPSRTYAVLAQCDEVSRLISGLVKALRKKLSNRKRRR